MEVAFCAVERANGQTARSCVGWMEDGGLSCS